ncbi:MAG: Na+/H+ antiporter NhaC family protein [Puniceicoccaceae bacterium]
MDGNKPLVFRGGVAISALPMVFFIIWAITICLRGAPDVRGLALGIIIGLGLAMALVKGSRWDYCEAIFTGMANRIGSVTIVAWLWAGMFAQVLRAGGLVDGLVWLGMASNVQGGLYVGVTFLLAALFSSAVGTGYGTTVAFCTLMYPAGIVLGAEPVFMFGAILSGAAFGDNLAPVSDTTIVSATTQETDIPGVVRSRFKYAITAAIPALLLFVFLGGATEEIKLANQSLADNVSPTGLVLLVPFALVIFLAMRHHHIIVSITVGLVVAVAVILLTGLGTLQDIVHINAAAGTLDGALTEGIGGYVDMAVLTLLILSASHIMMVGGAFGKIQEIAFSFIKDSVRRAELVICSFVATLNVFITVNTAAEIAAAPMVSEIGKKLKIHPYRRANLLDAITSALGYIFPWGGGVLIGYVTLTTLTENYPKLPVVNPTDVWMFVFHGWFLVVVMFAAAVTGLGRETTKE